MRNRPWVQAQRRLEYQATQAKRRLSKRAPSSLTPGQHSSLSSHARSADIAATARERYPPALSKQEPNHERRDPESTGVVEAGVRYIKRNALQGRADQLVTWQDYVQFARDWRDQLANVRIHDTTRQRPIDRFQEERSRLRPLPDIPYDTDEVIAAIVTPHARVRYDSNRYSVPPQFVRKPVTVRVSKDRK